MMRAALFVSLTLLPAGCGEDGAALADAALDVGLGRDAGTTIVEAPASPMLPAEPALPMEPAPPQLTPCPDGWTPTTTTEGDVACEPWPGAGPADCPPHEHHLPGTTGCMPVGATCAPDGRPSGFPSGVRVVWVSAGATSGDGSMTRPYGMVGRGITAAASGNIVAVTAGTYDEAVVVPAGVTLWGACAERTVLTSSSPAMSTGVVHVTEAGAVIRDLRIAASSRPGLSVRGASAALTARGVVVESTTRYGVLAWNGGRLDAANVSIRGITAASDDSLGVGVLAQDGEIALADATILDTASRGVLAFGSTVDLTRTAIRNAGARGVSASDMSTVTLDEAVFESARGSGVIGFGAGTTVTMDNTVVRDTGSEPLTLSFGRGVSTVDGAELVAYRSLFARNREAAASSALAGASLTLQDAIIRDTRSRESDTSAGLGLLVQMGGDAAASRVAFRRNRFNSVFVVDGGSAASLSDVVATETHPDELAGGQGRALNVQAAASFTLSRVRVEDCFEAGIASHGTDTTMEDVTIRRVRPTMNTGEFGRGFSVQSDAQVDAERVLVEEVPEVAGLIADRVTGRLADVTVRDTGAQSVGGLHLQFDTTATVDRMRVERAGTGVVSTGGGRATIRDLVVTDSIGEESFGRGVSVGDASMIVERARFSRVDSFGAFASDGGTLTISDLTVEDVRTAADGQFGRGVNAQLGATVDVVRAAIRRYGDSALYAASEGTVLRATDVAISEGRGSGEGRRGYALSSSDGATVQLERVRAEEPRGAGFAMSDSTVDAIEVEVLGTLPLACAETTCIDAGAGAGLVSYAGATTRIERFVVADAHVCGVQVASEGGMDLRDGIVRGAAIGACVQVDGYDLGRLTDDVVYVDNGINLQTTSLPVPDIAEPGEAVGTRSSR